MLRVIVDSGSSIKSFEKEKYNVDIIPLKILLGDKEYLDGVDLDLDDFYRWLIEKKTFPKTSLPSLEYVENLVKGYVDNGDDVAILPISSKISGTFNALTMLFKDQPKVRVIDTCLAVGGIRLIVDEINRNRDKTLDELEQIVKNFIPRIKVMALPETLDYLLHGGRLSRSAWMIGRVLGIKPVIGLKDGKVHVFAKPRGLKHGMRYILNALEEMECDPDYDIVASYTYDRRNLDKLIEMTPDKYKPQIRVFDNLDAALGCHWGPYAFGYIFVGKPYED